MDHTYWLKQSVDKPLFPDLLWSRPETKAGAGKLAIIGGNAQGFAAVAEAFNEAGKAGVGIARVLLPDSLQKTVSKLFPEAGFAPSTPSGSFGGQGLSSWLDVSLWSDCVLAAGDLGRNSETAILLEQFLDKYQGPLVLAGDSLDYFHQASAKIFNRPGTLVAPTFAQLQKLITAAHLPYNLSSGHQFVQHIESLHQLTAERPVNVVVALGSQVVVAVNGQISTTPKPAGISRLAAHSAVWWLQNPGQPFQSITTSIFG